MAAATTAVPARAAARRGPHPWLKPGVFAGALAPAASLAWRAAHGTLGANPIAEALNQLGLVALVFLVASLACTPLKDALGWTWPVRLRRMLGLFAFFYALLHLSTYASLDQAFAWRAILADVTKRKFIFVGFAAFVLLLPLAVTSTNGWVKRLGFARWKRLHRLAYAASVLATVHFIWRVKKDLGEPLVYASVLALLLAWRALAWARDRRRASRRLAERPVTSPTRPPSPSPSPSPARTGS